MDSFETTVTSAYSTYTARAAGKSASCTAGERQAIEALATKIFGKRGPIKVELIEAISMGKNKYKITKESYD